ncbi:MAG: hypothetical protein NVS1B9_13320 [Solirubrobacteraceae bacterium]
MKRILLLSGTCEGPALARALRHQPVRHAVRVRITDSRGALADVGLPFVVAGELRPLTGPRAPARIEVSIQDVIGFVRLLHRLTGAETLVRGSFGHLVTLLQAAKGVQLPASGPIVIAGRSSRVSAFARPGFAGEQLTVWVLAPA